MKELHPMKTALITGITGQDGAYLAAFLLGKQYRVIGTYRRTSTLDLWRLRYLGIDSQLVLECMDMEDMGSQIRVLQEYMPDEVYNLAAQSFAGVSFDQPILTSNVAALGLTNLLEAIRTVKPDTRFYQASTAEMFGRNAEAFDVLNEGTPFSPCSPYGTAKLFAHWMSVNYRESYDMYACSGIAFNHESPLRGLEFVTRTITDGVAQIKAGRTDTLVLGNLDARRDWGFAGDYVEAMWLMLQQDTPKDYVIATGRSYSVGDFVDLAFAAAGLGDASQYVKSQSMFKRPADIARLQGNPDSAWVNLHWKPKVLFSDLVHMMVDADVQRYMEQPTRLSGTA